MLVTSGLTGQSVLSSCARFDVGERSASLHGVRAFHVRKVR